jgi:hypothetical protein
MAGDGVAAAMMTAAAMTAAAVTAGGVDRPQRL